jgi:hypothetical protein
MRSHRGATQTLVLLSGVIVALAGGSPSAALAAVGPAASAEIFATSNEAVITDPTDPRLADRLGAFATQVDHFIRAGGGDPLSSRLLNGVFDSPDLHNTTFERSRDFQVAGVTPARLRVIAERIRARYHQQSVLTFDYSARPSAVDDAVDVELPGVSTKRLREGS